MRLKAVFPLLMLSCFFFLPSDCFNQAKHLLEVNFYPPDNVGDAVPITVGSYSLFAGRTGSVPFYGFNAVNRTTSITRDIWSTYVAYTTVGDVAYITSRNTVDNTFFAFNGTSGETWTLDYGQPNVGYRAFTSVGPIVVFAGGLYYDDEAAAWLHSNFVGIYDTTTKTFSNTSLPFARSWMTATSAGNYALFAGGQVDSQWKSDVAIFDINNRTFTTASLTSASNNTQAVSIDRFAIFVSGNVADIFDSNTLTWSTHTLSQAAASSYGFSIVKTQRYAFFVASGRADVFDSNTLAWSILTFNASTNASYCPSTVVGEYALFSCDTWVYIYDTANNNFVRGVEMTSRYAFKIIQAGAVGNFATFFVTEGINMYIYTMDFTTGPPNSDKLTPQAISPTLVSASLSTHQLSKTRTSYTAAGNKAVFFSSDASVDIYNSETNTWTTSTPEVATRGGLFATADSFVVFSDTANSSLLHALDLEASEWTIVEVPDKPGEAPNRYLITVGNYLFFEERGPFVNVIDGPMAYNLADKTWTSLGWSGTSIASLSAHKYRTYAVFANPNTRWYATEAYDTANNLAATSFGYGGESRILPSIAAAGDYLVIAGGVMDSGYSNDFSIHNPYAGESFVGKMPSARYGLTIIFVDPLMMFIGGNRIEFFNLDTQSWTVGFLDVSLAAYTVSGHKLFSYENTVVAFDSHTTLWYNITIEGTSVEKLSRLGGMTAFLNSDSIVVYNPSMEEWTKSTFSGKQFTDVFLVGDKAVFISSDGQTVDTVALSALISDTATPVAPPVTGQSFVNPVEDATVRSGKMTILMFSTDHLVLIFYLSRNLLW
jgi:hypothetical protein